MRRLPLRRLARASRLQLLFAGLGALGTVVLAVVGVLTYMASGSSPSAGGASTTTTVPPDARASTTVPTTPPSGVLLGRDVKPTASDPCRAPGSADGSAWQLGDVVVAGARLGPSYYCNLFAGGTGSVGFLLGKAYRTLTLTIALSDDSSARHRVRFEIVGDDTRYLAEPRDLRLGDAHELTVDVRHVTQLRLRITELGEPGGDDAPSKPVFARAALARATDEGM